MSKYKLKQVNTYQWLFLFLSWFSGRGVALRDFLAVWNRWRPVAGDGVVTSRRRDAAAVNRERCAFKTSEVPKVGKRKKQKTTKPPPAAAQHCSRGGVNVRAMSLFLDMVVFKVLLLFYCLSDSSGECCLRFLYALLPEKVLSLGC